MPTCHEHDWDDVNPLNPCPVCSAMNKAQGARIPGSRFLPGLLGAGVKQDPTCGVGVSDGSTARYYELPPGATELQDLISYKNMNAQMGEIFRSGYRYGESSHSDMLRDAKKIRFYINAEIDRLEKYDV